VRGLVDRELHAMLARQRRSYMPAGARERRTSILEEDRAWGLMPVGRYGEILERAVVRDYAPRFGEHGIEVAAAWQRSAAVGPG
jgi:hypothetical protein